MQTFPFLHARDHCPPAIRVTRWFAPQPMRRTLVREPGESEVAFCDRAQQLAEVWQSTGLMGPQRHHCLVMVECLYVTGRNHEAEDDRWAGQQLAMTIIGDVKTSDALRRDALRLLRELHTEAA